ncbi:Cysteine synthase 2 [Ceratocystis lukuohia]|uniref:Cysteine synthase 2 n=1 Tax=Ceratocystis lukuohia TaxID=2019550 RepID=A0ABR4MKF2_9PEZI
MSSHQQHVVYGSLALTCAFMAGILLTLGLKDLYPDLERRFRGELANSAFALSRRSSWFFGGPVALEDHEAAVKKSSGSKITGNAGSPEEGTLILPGIVQGIEGCIGNTPLMRIKSLSEATGREIFAKVEFLNGAGNTPKDRVALSMIRAAEAEGLLRPGHRDVIFEGTVGSTGISLATIARARGYRAHIFMPDDIAHEKSDLLKRLGATVERVPVQPITSPQHYVNLARSRAAALTASTDDEANGFFADQFETSANYAAHLATTGPEIFLQTAGRLDAFVAGAGTGGTLAGIAQYLKLSAGMDKLKIVLADPQGSGLYNKVLHGVMYSPTEKEGTRRRTQVDSIVEGIGINRITANFESGRDLIDDAVRVTDEQACKMARWLVEHDGIFAGSSTAVNCTAAVVAAMKLPEGSRVVTIICDPGNRHLSKFWRIIGDMEPADPEADLFTSLGVAK